MVVKSTDSETNCVGSEPGALHARHSNLCKHGWNKITYPTRSSATSSWRSSHQEVAVFVHTLFSLAGLGLSWNQQNVVKVTLSVARRDYKRLCLCSPKRLHLEPWPATSYYPTQQESQANRGRYTMALHRRSSSSGLPGTSRISVGAILWLYRYPILNLSSWGPQTARNRQKPYPSVPYLNSGPTQLTNLTVVLCQSLEWHVMQQQKINQLLIFSDSISYL